MDPINTIPIQQFIQNVKAAESNKSREVKMSLSEAKLLSHSIAMAMARLNGDLEEFLSNIEDKDLGNDIEVEVNGGSW